MPFSSNALIVLAASNGSSGKGGASLAGFLPLLLIVLVVYLLFIRPARSRQRAAQQTRTTVEPGVEVTTTAGLIATVVAVDDATVTLEIAPGVHSRFVKAAIGRVNTPPEPDEPDERDEPVEPIATDDADPTGETPAGTGA